MTNGKISKLFKLVLKDKNAVRQLKSNLSQGKITIIQINDIKYQVKSAYK